jgi:lipopolysaccharide assembly outer membrane protein LptD (OstA)
LRRASVEPLAIRLALLLCWALLLGAGPLLLAGAARAADDVPFTVNADSIEFDSVRSVYVARGNVRIRQGQQSLTADWVMFSSATRQGLASGHVVHQDGPDRLVGDFLQFEIDTLKGFARQGVLTSDESRYRMAAVEVRKTGEETYTFKQGAFTTCQCPDGGDPPWELKAEEASLELDGYAVAKNTTFEMFGLPVLWLPWAAYPLKRERSTGFLFPELNSTNRSGIDVGLPFFWAARHDLNVTLTPQWLRDRGFKGVAELDWHVRGNSRGSLFFTMLSDGQVEDDDPQQPYDELRWAVDSQQDWRLPLGFRAKVDANLMRDNQFTRDFRDMRQHASDRFLESVGFVSRSFLDSGSLQWSAGARFADDLQNPDDLDRDEVLVQRLPESSLRMLARPLVRLGPVSLVASLDADYAYFWSHDKASDDLPGLVVGDDVFVDTGRDGVPSSQEQDSAGRVTALDQNNDDFATTGGPEGDGQFQEGELLGDRGHRVFLYPRLSAPFRIADMVEVVPEVGYHTTLYETEGQSFEERGMVTGRLDVSTQLRRSFAPGFVSRPVTHVVEPFLSWGIVQQTSQDANPLFIPDTAEPQERLRLLELDSVTGDPADRVESFHGFTIGVRNELIGRALGALENPESGEIEYVADQSRLVADVTLAYSYEISGSRLGNFVVDGSWWPWANWSSKFHVNWDTSRNEVDEGLVRFSYWGLQGHSLGIQYRFVKEIPEFFEEFRSDRDRLDDFEEDFDQVNQLTVDTRYAVSRQWAVTYDVGYTFEEQIFLRHRAGVEYTSRCLCWAVRLDGDFRRESGFDIGFKYTFLGLGDDPIRPFSGGGTTSLRR